MWCCRCFCPNRQNDEESMIDSQSNMTDPEIIYSCPVFMDPQVGYTFYVTGRIRHTCERFSINLVLGTLQKDIALHINPRLPQNYIVRNSKIGGVWGTEERSSALPFILHRGDKFAIQILVAENEFMIAVNGRHFAVFSHRLPYQKIKNLEVKGDVTDVLCEQLIISNYPEPACESSIYPIKELKDNTNFEQFIEKSKLLVPFYGQLENPFTNGHTLYIYGRLKILPHSFFINIQEGNQIWPHPRIHFHFNPRFASVGGKHIIVKNAWMENNWGNEERSECNISDFVPGKEFLLKIQNNYHSYHIYLNDKFIADFQFRDTPKSTFHPDNIYIQGDVQLYRIYVLNSNEDNHNET